MKFMKKLDEMLNRSVELLTSLSLQDTTICEPNEVDDLIFMESWEQSIDSDASRSFVFDDLYDAIAEFHNQDLLFTEEEETEDLHHPGEDDKIFWDAIGELLNQNLFTEEEETEDLHYLGEDDKIFWDAHDSSLFKPFLHCYIDSKDFVPRGMDSHYSSLFKPPFFHCFIDSKDFVARGMGRKKKELLSNVFLVDLQVFLNKMGGRMLSNPGNQTLLLASVLAKSVSHPPQIQLTTSDRNRKKRLEKKIKNKAKQQELDNDLSRVYTCLLYMFASMHSGGYLLYRIDALEHTSQYNENNELLPLLVFGPDILPVGFCTMLHMGDYIYFVGEKPCDVFKIRKHDLTNITPSEDNLGLEFLIPIKQPMNGPKMNPLVFVANNILYVISRDYSYESHDFEKYSPTDDSWTDMNPKPKGHGSLKSHVVLEDIAYFATTDETVLSCNLTNGCWSIVSTAPKYPRTFCDIHPAFDAPVEIVGGMMLGAFKLPSDFNITVAASPYSRCNEAVKDSFMRPTLAPDSKFWSEFAPRFDYIRNNESHGSHYMTALQTLDGQNILCFVSYGSNPSIDEPHRSYALLTFYKILGDHWKTSVRLKEEVLEGGDTFCYYSRQVEAGNAVKSYFKSEFMQRKLFNITTPKLHITGKLITCLAY